jgi:fatty-acyl-CoA synthase
MTPRSFTRNPMSWLERCAATKTSVTAAPNFAYRLVTFSLRNGFFDGDLSSLRVCLCGAERVSADVMQRFVDAGEPYGLPSTAVMPVYGLAEGTLAVCFPPLDRQLHRGPGDTVTVGSPLPGVEMRVVDVDESGRGELELRGSWMLDHYVTADGPQSPFGRDGWYATHDVVSVVDGELIVHGRNDEVAVIRGRNLCAEDVESIVGAVSGDRLGFHAAFRVTDDAFAVAAEWLSLDDTSPAQLILDIRNAVA